MSSRPPASKPTAAAVSCSACGARLKVASRFCQECGAAVAPSSAGHASPADRRWASRIPWVIAAGSLIALVAVVVSRQPSAAENPSIPLAAPAAPANSPPNIEAMSPSDRASRLYVRVMQYAETGKLDSVAVFAPMVIAAHEMLAAPSVDERYHFGRVAEVIGNLDIAAAQADTILARTPNSLLGLLLAARAARAAHHDANAQRYGTQFLAVLTAELATDNVDYENHRAEIDQAVKDARAAK